MGRLRRTGLLVAVGMLAACRPSPPPSPTTTPESESADGPDLPAALERGVEAGLAPAVLEQSLAELLSLPRTLGHPDRGASIDALIATLEQAGAVEIERDPIAGTDPRTGDAFALVSVYAHFRPDAARRFVLATHFDIRPWADEDPDPEARDRPVPGANDGTSGLAVVLALAPILERRLPDDVGFSVALFDGEELGRPAMGGYCAGSRALAARPDAPDAIGRRLRTAELGIVLDMVGDADLRLSPEPSSLEHHPDLVDALWTVGAAQGSGAFDPMPRAQSLIDDHTFLTEAGVPSILVIDYEYDAWHTEADTLARTSGESLSIVAEAVRSTLLRHYASTPLPPEPARADSEAEPPSRDPHPGSDPRAPPGAAAGPRSSAPPDAPDAEPAATTAAPAPGS